MSLPPELRRESSPPPEGGKLLNPWTVCKSGTEHAEQMALFIWASVAARYGLAAANDLSMYEAGALSWPLPKPHVLELLYAIPNGGLRDKITAANMKAEGARAGIPDVHFPVGRHGFRSLYIEMKRIKYKPKKPGGAGGRSPEQIAMGSKLQEQGNYVATCYGFEEARQCLIWYLEGVST